MDFLLEIGTEELPADQLVSLVEQLGDLLRQQLLPYAIGCEQIDYWATPRRLAVCWRDLPEQCPERVQEIRGPALERAYDADKRPTPAGLGFAKSCGVAIDALQTKTTTKGAWLVHQRTIQGLPLAELLPDLVMAAVKQLRYPRAMRWSDQPHWFIRPVHWVLALLDTEVLALSLLGQLADRLTYGHRFMFPEAVSIPSVAQYESILKTRGVIADIQQRRNLIIRESEKLATQVDGNLVLDDALVNEITGLVEYPVPILGHFSKDYLTLPAEVLVEVLRHHQKCFALSRQQQILPAFIWISHIQSTCSQSVVAGNERVIQARLSDAAFFFAQDKQQRLDSYLEALADIQWHVKLGSLDDKCQRLVRLTKMLCQQLQRSDSTVCRAARLAKFDLATAMVNEFPVLQGIMGYHYALYFGETAAVARAIKEHNQLIGDEAVWSDDGRILALADRMDTLVGYFSIQLRPTGEKDPYALRRAALGIVQLLIEGQWFMPLQVMLTHAVEGFKLTEIATDTIEALLDYIRERMYQWLLEQAIRPDVIQAVFATKPDDLYDAYLRVIALMTSESSSLSALSQLNKRVSKLLAKSDGLKVDGFDSALVQHDSERCLLTMLKQAEQQQPAMMQARDYQQIIETLGAMSPVMNKFFEETLILHPDPIVRQHRLCILQRLKILFQQVADITLLQLDKI